MLGYVRYGQWSSLQIMMYIQEVSDLSRGEDFGRVGEIRWQGSAWFRWEWRRRVAVFGLPRCLFAENGSDERSYRKVSNSIIQESIRHANFPGNIISNHVLKVILIVSFGVGGLLSCIGVGMYMYVQREKQLGNELLLPHHFPHHFDCRIANPMVTRILRRTRTTWQYER